MGSNRAAAHLRAQKEGRLRDQNTCQICGSRRYTEGHHIINHQYQGAADKENIITLCQGHHKEVHKGNIDIVKF